MNDYNGQRPTGMDPAQESEVYARLEVLSMWAVICATAMTGKTPHDIAIKLTEDFDKEKKRVWKNGALSRRKVGEHAKPSPFQLAAGNDNETLAAAHEGLPVDAELRTVHFKPGAKIIISTDEKLDADRADRIKHFVQNWAGDDMEVLVLDRGVKAEVLNPEPVNAVKTEWHAIYLARKVADYIEGGAGQCHAGDEPCCYTDELMDFGIDGRVNLVALMQHLLDKGIIITSLLPKKTEA